MEPLQLQQDLTDAGDFQHVFVIKLLFDGRPQRPEMEQLLPALRQALGEVEVVSGGQQLSSFALLAHLVTYRDGQRMPAQVLIADVAPFDAGEIGPLERSQLWDVPDGEALLDGVGYQLMLSDFLASGLDYKERCWILSKWLEIVLKLLPQCQAVWVPASGKLLTRDQLLRNPEQFVYWAVKCGFSILLAPRICWWIPWACIPSACRTYSIIFEGWIPMRWSCTPIMWQIIFSRRAR